MAVNLTFTGDSNDAVAAIAKLERKWQDLENKMKNTKPPRMKSDIDETAASLDRVIGKWASIGTGINLASATVRGFMELNNKVKDQLNEFADKKAENEIKLQIQGGLAPKEIQHLIPQMQKTLVETPTTDLFGAYKIQTQLASSGFNEKDVKSGEALRTVLDIKAATNQFGESIGDEKEAVKALSMMLKAGGSENPSAAEMRKLGGSVVSLFESSEVEFPDFKQLAPKISQLKNFGMSMEESVSSFSTLTDIMGGSKADTALTQFVSRAATAGAYPERAEALKSLGIKPEEIAMAPGGIGFKDTLQLIRDRTKGVPDTKRNNAFAKIFGEEAGPAAGYLTGDAGFNKYSSYLDKSTTREPFERNIKAFRESRFADDARTGVKDQIELNLADKKTGSFTWKEYEQKNELAHKKALNDAPSGLDRSSVQFGKYIRDTRDWLAQGLGMFPGDIGRTRDSMNNEPGGIIPYKSGAEKFAEGQAKGIVDLYRGSDSKPKAGGGNGQFTDDEIRKDPSKLQQNNEGKENAEATKENTIVMKELSKKIEEMMKGGGPKTKEEAIALRDAQNEEFRRKRVLNPNGNRE